MTAPETAPAKLTSTPPRDRRSALSRFFFPTVNRGYLLRLGAVAALAYLFFGYICIPARIQGRSMEPTYRDGGFAFCWRPRFWFKPPPAGRVVMVRIAGRRLMYLKRVVASGGSTVEFRQGQLWVNGQPCPEPYVSGPCDWALSPRVVPSGQVYVIGDNRSMPIEEHTFGSVPVDRIEGGPAW
jgi:signal peptidase I